MNIKMASENWIRKKTYLTVLQTLGTKVYSEQYGEEGKVTKIGPYIYM